MEDFEYRCSKCGGTNVEIKFWVNPNDLLNTDICGEQEILSDKDCFCKDCEDNILVVYVEKE